MQNNSRGGVASPPSPGRENPRAIGTAPGVPFPEMTTTRRGD